jgi:hypothetical protein
MKYTYLFFILLLASCNTNENKQQNSTAEFVDSLSLNEQLVEDSVINTRPLKKYANKRFKDVTVEKVGKDSFQIQGQGQIFEASFNWVIEDGHNELKSGFETTDVGAPEWGNFSFIIAAPEKNDYSTLMLLLYETSAEDGSRQHELPLVLE